MSNSLEFCELGFRILGLLVSQLGPLRSRACARSGAGWVTWAGGSWAVGMRECGDWNREGMKDALTHEEQAWFHCRPPRNLADSPRPRDAGELGRLSTAHWLRGTLGISLPTLCSCSCTGLSNPLGDRESPRPAPSRWVR